MSFTLPTDPYLPDPDLLTAGQFKAARTIRRLIILQIIVVSGLSYIVGDALTRQWYAAIAVMVVVGLSYGSFGRIFLIRMFTTAHLGKSWGQVYLLFYGWTLMLFCAGWWLTALRYTRVAASLEVPFVVGAIALIVCSLASGFVSRVAGPEIAKKQAEAIFSKVAMIAEEKANEMERQLRTIVPVESDETRAHPVMRLPVVTLKTDEDKQIAKSMLRVALGIDDRLI